jgi:exodeoxyribonuclease-5
VVTRSNRRAIQYNQGIRGRILGHEEELSGGDLLMVAKNNYFWCKDNKELPFIANGDVAVVRRFRNERSLYGFRFADVTLQLPDYDDMELDAVVLLDTLRSEASALTRQEQEQLFHNVWEDYPEITNKQARAKKIKEDTYYNALQVKYAYAVTCHKAQGGQWQRVFIDQGYVTEDMLSPDYFRWLYTAITRATETVYLVNWPENQLLQME